MLLAYKCAGDGFIYVINLTSLLERKQQHAKLVCGLQWTRTDTQYINLAASMGNYSCLSAHFRCFSNLFLADIGHYCWLDYDIV